MAQNKNTIDQETLDLLEQNGAGVILTHNHLRYRIPYIEIYKFFFAKKLLGTDVGAYIIDGINQYFSKTHHMVYTDKNGQEQDMVCSVADNAGDAKMQVAVWQQVTSQFIVQAMQGGEDFDAHDQAILGLLNFKGKERDLIYPTPTTLRQADQILGTIPTSHCQVLEDLFQRANLKTIHLFTHARSVSREHH